MTRARLLTATVALLAWLACSACRRDGCSESKPAAVEAAAPPDRTLRLVAMMPAMNELRTYVLADGHIIFAVGNLFYEGRPDGAVVPLASVAAHRGLEREDAPLWISMEQPLRERVLGETASSIWIRRERREWLTPGTEPKVPPEEARPNVFELKGGQLHATADRNRTWVARMVRWRRALLGVSEAENAIVRADGQDSPVPKVPTGVVLVHSDPNLFVADDRLVALTDPPGALVWTGLTSEAKRVPLDTDATQCASLPAFDGHVYLLCGAGTLGARVPAVYRLDADGWTHVDYPRTDRGAAASIASDHSLYSMKNGEIVRSVGPDTPLELLAPSLAGVPTAKVHYTRTKAILVYDTENDRPMPVLRVHPGAEAPVPTSTPPVTEIIARSSNDVWVMAAGYGYIFHSGPAREIVQLPSVVDSIAMIAEASGPPARWVGHCEPIFVRLTGRADGGAIDREVVMRSESEIKSMLGVEPDGTIDDFHQALGWALVEGRLGDETVGGVLVHRNTLDMKLPAFEKRVTSLVDKLAERTGIPPSAFCSLPVLERVLSR
jgi:hypothetical protein